MNEHEIEAYLIRCFLGRGIKCQQLMASIEIEDFRKVYLNTTT